jgi:hypothetical protein
MRRGEIEKSRGEFKKVYFSGSLKVDSNFFQEALEHAKIRTVKKF